MQDCPGVDERSICLASLGLNPVLPWESMGIRLWFGNDGNDPPVDLDRIHPKDQQEMDDQIHSSSLWTSHSYRHAMEFLLDDLDYLLDMEEHRTFLYHTQSHSPLASISSLLLMECKHLCTPLHYRLISRGDSSILLLLSSAQSSRAWTLRASYNKLVFAIWTAERKHQQSNSIEQHSQFRLACNIIDHDCLTPSVPDYQPAELESWTVHLIPSLWLAFTLSSFACRP